jgi:hypothetical protein
MSDSLNSLKMMRHRASIFPHFSPFEVFRKIEAIPNYSAAAALFSFNFALSMRNWI